MGLIMRILVTCGRRWVWWLVYSSLHCAVAPLPHVLVFSLQVAHRHRIRISQTSPPSQRRVRPSHLNLHFRRLLSTQTPTELLIARAHITTL